MSVNYEIRIEPSLGQPLAVVRRRASRQELARIVPEACGTVWNVLRAQKVAGAGRHVAIYWDEQINLEVGVELPAPFAGAGDVIGSATPAGTVATTTHYGPYGQLHMAYRALHEWCANHGHALAGPCWEVYGHWLDEWNDDPTKIRTDVHFLLADDRQLGIPGGAG